MNNLGINITSNGNNFGISNTGNITGTNITGNSLAIGSAGINSNGDISGRVFHTLDQKAYIDAEGGIRGTTLRSTGEAHVERSLNVEGNFYIGKGAPEHTVYINMAGTINTVSDVIAQGDVYSRGLKLTSDARLKKDIVDTDLGLEVIRKINIKNYKFKKETKKDNVHIGVIAQDIQKILPSAVFKGEDGFLSISPNDIFFVAINAIKELDKELQSLKNQNNELKNQVELLKKQNQNLEKRLSKIEKNHL